MSEMVERLAKALWENDDDLFGGMLPRPSWKEAGRKQAEPYYLEARAVLAALREPTEAMCDRVSGYLMTHPIPSGTQRSSRR